MATISISAPATYRRPASTPSTPVRLTARGRRLARTAIVLLALLTVLAFGLAGRMPASAGDSGAVPATATVVVQPGQSLWGIAQSVAPHDDVRATIERITTLNNLDSTTVVPGQQLIVPAAG
jgi:hypothetical protein